MIMEASKKKWKKVYHEQIKMGICYCYLCGRLIESKDDFSIEHRCPTSRGGYNTPANWSPAHKSCNNEKGALTYEEYREWQRLEYLRNGGKIK